MSSLAAIQLMENKTAIQGGGKPRMVCLNCNDRVCKICWSTYDNYPAFKKIQNPHCKITVLLLPTA